MPLEEIIYPGQFTDPNLCEEARAAYETLVRDVRTFQAGLFHNLIRQFPAYGTYLNEAYYVSTMMGEGGCVHVDFGDRSEYSIEIGLAVPKDPRSRVARVQTLYDFSGAGVASPQYEEFHMSRRNLLIGIIPEFSKIIGEMSVGTSFITEGGVDYLGRQGNSLSHTYELVNVYQNLPDGYGVAYSQVGYRRF